MSEGGQLQDTQRLAVAAQVARQAGELAKRFFSNLSYLTITSKGIQDMVTEADLEVERLVRAAIQEHYPDDAFLGEETYRDFSEKEASNIWVVDPIDGTQAFVNGIPSWCVSIAYVVDDQVEIGVVFDPVHDELYTAARGQGANLNGRPIAVSDSTDVNQGLMGVGLAISSITPDQVIKPMERLLREDGVFHRCGSGALSLAYVAAGRLLGYFEPHMQSWDALAGLLLVSEAGGRCNFFLEDRRSLIEGNQVVAAAAGVFEALAEITELPLPKSLRGKTD